MNIFQKKIKQFAEERNWGQFHNPKDLLLGVVEEVGELRNIIKWEQSPEKLKQVMEQNKEEVKDNIGDIYWFLALLANSVNIDIDEAIYDVIENNSKRFPVTEVKSQHTNLYLGGKDNQYPQRENKQAFT